MESHTETLVNEIISSLGEMSTIEVKPRVYTPKLVLFMQGLPGAGKSTMALALYRLFIDTGFAKNPVILNPDADTRGDFNAYLRFFDHALHDDRVDVIIMDDPHLSKAKQDNLRLILPAQQAMIWITLEDTRHGGGLQMTKSTCAVRMVSRGVHHIRHITKDVAIAMYCLDKMADDSVWIGRGRNKTKLVNLDPYHPVEANDKDVYVIKVDISTSREACLKSVWNAMTVMDKMPAGISVPDKNAIKTAVKFAKDIEAMTFAPAKKE